MKFDVGELAIVWSPGYDCHGAECEIVLVGPLPAGHVVSGPVAPGRITTLMWPHDYEIRLGPYHWGCQESQLRKRRPPIPEDVLEAFRVRQNNPDLEEA